MTSDDTMPMPGIQVAEYNYPNFLGQEDFDTFVRTHHVGEKAPDCELTDLNAGAQVTLAALWRSAHVVLEFGSYT